MINSQQYGQLQYLGYSNYNRRSDLCNHNGISMILLRTTSRSELMERARSLQNPVLACSLCVDLFPILLPALHRGFILVC